MNSYTNLATSDVLHGGAHHYFPICIDNMPSLSSGFAGHYRRGNFKKLADVDGSFKPFAAYDPLLDIPMAKLTSTDIDVDWVNCEQTNDETNESTTLKRSPP